MIQHELNYYGVELIVKGDYYKCFSSTYEDPAEPATFEISSIIIGFQNATDLLEDKMEDIELEIINQYYS